jgi:hypothetical protein
MAQFLLVPLGCLGGHSSEETEAQHCARNQETGQSPSRCLLATYFSWFFLLPVRRVTKLFSSLSTAGD